MHDMCLKTVSMNLIAITKTCHMFPVWTGKMQSIYIMIITGAGVLLLILLIVVGVFKKR